MSGDGKRSVAEWPKLPRPSSTLPGSLRSDGERDRVVAQWSAQHLNCDVFEDRSLDTTSLLDISLARLCPFWRGFEFISNAGPEDSLLLDDAEGVIERKNGASEGTCWRPLFLP